VRRDFLEHFGDVCHIPTALSIAWRLQRSHNTRSAASILLSLPLSSARFSMLRSFARRRFKVRDTILQ
jgi:hypothetical protein